MSFSCFEKYDVLRTYDHKPTLSNASNETIEVMKVCDVRVRFGKQVVVGALPDYQFGFQRVEPFCGLAERVAHDAHEFPAYL